VQGREQLAGVRPTSEGRRGFGEGDGVAHSTSRNGGPSGGEGAIALRLNCEAQRQVGPAAAADRAGVVGGTADGAV
jgi:hypothetical protein